MNKRQGFVVPLGRLAEAVKSIPEAELPLWSKEPCGEWDMRLRQWNSREVLARAIRMQERGATLGKKRLHAVVPLGLGEGY